jgi:hypothetical protein
MCNTFGDQRRLPERPEGKAQLVFWAQFVPFNYRSNSFIRHRFYNREIFVGTKKILQFRTQHSIQIKKLSYTVVRREAGGEG